MEFIVGIVLPVAIILAGVLQSKDTNWEEKKSYKTSEIRTAEKIVRQESIELKTEDRLVEKGTEQKMETTSSSSLMHTVPSVAKNDESPKNSSLTQEVRTARIENKEPFKYSIDVIEGTINHYVINRYNSNLRQVSGGN
ncbi:hypothetical protein [Thermocrinis sp.]